MQVGNVLAFSFGGDGGAISITSAGTAGIAVGASVDTTSFAPGQQSGNIVLTATNGGIELLDGAIGLLAGEGTFGNSGNGGNITVEASGALALTAGGIGRVEAGSDGGNGGVILLRSTGAGVAAGWVNASAYGLGTYNAGSVTIEALGTGASGVQVGNVLAVSFGGDGGAISITSAGTAGIAVGASVDTTSFAPGQQSGNIVLAATNGGIELLDGATGLLAGAGYNYGHAGNITVEASGALDLTAGRVEASSYHGDGGVILLRSTGAGVAAEWVDASAYGFGTGNAGSVTIAALSTGASGVQVGNVLAASFGGDGGAISITSAGTEGITLGVWASVDTTSRTAGQQSGNIVLTATNGGIELLNGAVGLLAGAGFLNNFGHAGNITVEASGALNLTAGRVEASSLGGDGGVILLRSLGAGVAAGWTDASASDFATGNAGSVTIEALGTGASGVQVGNVLAFSAGGDGGAISITSAGTAGITVTGTIDTTGALLSGNITLHAPSVSLANIVTGVSAIEITSQTVTLGSVWADGTFHIAPQVGQTTTNLELTGSIAGEVELDFDLGTAGSLLVASGAALGGRGTIAGTTTILGTLAPGNSPGTLTFAGDLDVSDAEEFVFELGVPASDLVVLTLGTLSIDSLGLDDFMFADAGGFAPGDYLLFDTGSAIIGSLDLSQITGTVLGYAAELQLTNGGQDVTLSVTPEPTGALLLAGGGALLLGTRRRGKGQH